MTKKKKNELLNEFTPTFQLAGAGLGSSILGGSLQSKIPTGTINPLTQTGSTIGTFIPLTATLGVASFTTKKLKKLGKKIKGR